MQYALIWATQNDQHKVQLSKTYHSGETWLVSFLVGIVHFTLLAIDIPVIRERYENHEIKKLDVSSTKLELLLLKHIYKNLTWIWSPFWTPSWIAKNAQHLNSGIKRIFGFRDFRIRKKKITINAQRGILWIDQSEY